MTLAFPYAAQWYGNALHDVDSARRALAHIIHMEKIYRSHEPPRNSFEPSDPATTPPESRDPQADVTNG